MLVIRGTLKKWEDNRGFGFISRDDTGEEVFVHISAFSSRRSRPKTGERLEFIVEIGQDGKKRAQRVIRLGQGSSRARKYSRSRGEKLFFTLVTAAFYFLFLQNVPSILKEPVVALYREYAPARTQTQRFPPVQPPALRSPVQSSPPVRSSFQCDGRTRCREMHSCEEAMFFLKNCPGVKMDGDGDGIPCEGHLCN